VTIIQRNSGTFTGTSIVVAPTSGAFGSGTVLVIAVFGNTTVTTLSGWTQRTNSVIDMGLYSYDKAGAGESSVTFTCASGSGEWHVWELSSGSTWLNGSASQTATAGSTQATPSNTPTAGNRHILAVVGGNGGGNTRNVTAVSAGFTKYGDLQVTTQDWTFSAAADLDVTANGSTAYTTTGTFSGSVGTRGGMTLAYVNAAAAVVNPPRKPLVRAQAVGYASTW
jgi:hypothetical protein